MPKLLDIGLVALGRLRRPRAMAGLAFLAVGAGIFANALFLQAGPHPAPFFFTREHERPRPGQPDELVRSIQDALMQRGYYSGPLDGFAGPQTQSAIVDFRDRTGDEGSTEVSLELLSEIRSSQRPDLSPVATRVESPAEQPQPVPQAAREPAGETPEPPDGTVAAVQEALARSAYGPLTIDGVAGQATRDAIMRFQKDHNLPVTGEVSDSLVVELRAAGALGGG